MGDIEAPGTTGPRQSVLQTILPIAKEFASSRKGQLLIAEVALSLIAFICFVASTAAAFVTAPLIEFLAALFLLFAYSTKFNERFKGFHFPLMNSLKSLGYGLYKVSKPFHRGCWPMLTLTLPTVVTMLAGCPLGGGPFLTQAGNC
ncbi:CKLF-like MARVEL transmembrane domain-containing protein 3 isoform X2 [Oncorhynchus nerka]|uniref:CKLF-like MARVEL transmembrane domain-containing protein 3 isoform X2 n=1 Tax=Oncorhynchus nerka TaxID=8023 RepID=UPI0031B87938